MSEKLTEERMAQIKNLFEYVALRGEHLHHAGTPWPDEVSRLHTAVWDLWWEVRRLQKKEADG